jgi:hypothetical protein
MTGSAVRINIQQMLKVERLEIVHNSSDHPVWGEKEISSTDRHTLAEWLKEDEESAFSGTRALSLKLLFICTQARAEGCQK